MGIKKDVEKLIKDLNYHGCKNCKNQIETLRSCEWAESGGDGHLHFMCPMWEEKDDRN